MKYTSYIFEFKRERMNQLNFIFKQIGKKSKVAKNDNKNNDNCLSSVNFITRNYK